VIRAAADRYTSAHDGVRSWHCFSAGAHYHPDNVSHGSVVGVDEHVIAPGAGFDWHGHRNVTIVSYVVSGRLRHEDDAGRVRRVGAGEVLVQRTGAGIRHCEVNASAREPLRLIQTTLVDGGDGPTVTTTAPPVVIDGARVEVWTCDGTLDAATWHVLAVAGEWRVDGELFCPGDSARGAGALAMTGSGELLVVSER
jgi:quercetin dioxygenase-like cupin family protein